MPKLVDHEARRRELAEATWRVVHRAGTGGATVREVAAEAGHSPGSLRYYFPTQAGLIAFAMEVVAGRVRDRIAELEPGSDVRSAVERALEQVLPVDDERKTEMEVWLAFSAHAQTDEALRAQRDSMHADLRRFVRQCLGTLLEAELMRHELSLEQETTRLHALIDGLALHGITSPGRATPARIRKVLRAHLATLA